jgi:hypothetical protein
LFIQQILGIDPTKDKLMKQFGVDAETLENGVKIGQQSPPDTNDKRDLKKNVSTKELELTVIVEKEGA